MNATETVSNAGSAPAIEQGSLPVRNHQTWMPGDAAHQGDLILICLAALPMSAKVRRNRQMAEGETMGSRHVVAGGEVYDADPKEVAAAISEATKGCVAPTEMYIGPVFSGPCVLEHPQHQHQSFPGETVTACIFQRNQTAEDQEARARD